MGNKYVCKVHICETHAFFILLRTWSFVFENVVLRYVSTYKPSIFLLTKIEHLPKNTADLYMYALYLQNK